MGMCVLLHHIISTLGFCLVNFFKRHKDARRQKRVKRRVVAAAGVCLQCDDPYLVREHL